SPTPPRGDRTQNARSRPTVAGVPLQPHRQPRLPPERRPLAPKPARGESYRSAAIRVMRKMTMKIKNRMRAIPAAAEATPPNPNTPATNAMTAKMSAQVSMSHSPCWIAGFQGCQLEPAPPGTRGSSVSVPSEDAREVEHPSRACPETRNHAEQILSGERLADQGGSLVLLGQLLTPIAAHKGEGHPPRKQGVGYAAHRLSAKIGVEQSAVHFLAFERPQRVAHRRQRSDHDKPTLLERTGNIEGDEKLVFDHEDAFARHLPPNPYASEYTKLLLCFIKYGQFDQAHLQCGEQPGNLIVTGSV